jgi:mono/diheme cytochrome c family protein
MNIIKRNRSSAVLITLAILVAIVDGFSAASMPATASQDAQRKPGKTVWDGVFTKEQAARGKGEYEDNCAACHSTGEGPTLFGEAFMRRWFEDNLNAPFTKMRTQMPLDSPGTLPDKAYVDVISFLLASSGFPAGAEELRPDPELLASIFVVEKEGTGGPAPNFSLVQVVGCLTQGADKSWVLTKGTEPVRARESGNSNPADLKVSEARPLGSQAFRLLDFPLLNRDTMKGHKVQAKGYLIRQPNSDDSLNLTSLQTLAESCAQ